MVSYLTDAVRADLAAWLFRVSMPTPPTLPLKLALVAVNGDGTTAGTEPTASGYARQSVSLPAAAGSISSTDTTVSFGVLNSTGATSISGYELWDSSPRRLMWYPGASSQAVVVPSGDPVEVAGVHLATQSLFSEFTTTVENLMLDWLTGKNPTPLTGPFVARLVAANPPADRNTSAVEVSGDQYQRQTLTFSAAATFDARWTSLSATQDIYVGGYEIWSASGVRVLRHVNPGGGELVRAGRACSILGGGVTFQS